VASASAIEACVVFVVDDDVSVRESLALLIRASGWEPRTFESAQAFLDHPRARIPSCLLLDLSMPYIDGLTLQDRLVTQNPDLPIIFVTGHADVPKTIQALKAGAVEFLTKPLQADVLIAAIAGALERSRAALARDARVQALRDRYDGLTPREREVLALVVAGLLNKQVGSELGISLPTVKAHRGSMMRKMRARSVPELVTMCATLGIAPAPKSRFSDMDASARFGQRSSKR
jgi:FixJ family two-component response regulator